MPRPRPIATASPPLAVVLAMLAWASPTAAAGLRVTVIDERGEPLEHVAVYATARSPIPPRSAPPPMAVMDQHDNRFAPHVLIVQTGTEVLFPNNDVVSHHVYSFSEAKSFELGLYKGTAYPPVRFDHPGPVVLGCNIHDGMLGYIYVVDTPFFALTDAQGVATLLSLPSGDYAVEAWTPRARPANLPGPEQIALNEAGGKVALRVTGKLAPEHDDARRSLSWERY
jgi:plastocyanin